MAERRVHSDFRRDDDREPHIPVSRSSHASTTSVRPISDAVRQRLEIQRRNRDIVVPSVSNLSAMPSERRSYVPTAQEASQAQPTRTIALPQRHGSMPRPPYVDESEGEMESYTGSTTTTSSESDLKTPDSAHWDFKMYCTASGYTALFLYCYLGVGFLNSIIGPLLTHMQKNTGVTVEEVGWVLTLRGIGLMVGTPISGLLFDTFKKPDGEKFRWFDLSINRVLIVFLILMALSLVVVPFVTQYWLLLVVHLCQGIFSGVAEVGCNLAMAWVWRWKVKPFLQMLHCFSAIGSLTFPLIIAQIFLYVPDPDLQITVAYVACGILVAIACIPLLLLPAPTHSRREPAGVPLKVRFRGIVNRVNQGLTKIGLLKEYTPIVTEADKEKKPLTVRMKEFMKQVFSFSTFVYALTAVLKGTATGGYSTYGALLFQYAQRKELAGDVTLAYLVTTFWISFAASRGIGIFATMVVRPFLLLLMCITMTVVAYVIMLANLGNLAGLWLGAVLHGCFCAPISASAVALPQTSFGIQLNAVSMSMVSLGSTIGEMLIPTAITGLGYGLGVETFLYALLVNFVIAWVALFTIFIFGNIYMRKQAKLEEEEMYDEDMELDQLPVKGKMPPNSDFGMSADVMKNQNVAAIGTGSDLRGDFVEVEVNMRGGDEAEEDEVELDMGEVDDTPPEEREGILSRFWTAWSKSLDGWYGGRTDPRLYGVRVD